MNDDLISRNALIQHGYSAIVDGVEKDIIDLSDVDNAPTVEPEKVKAGELIKAYTKGFDTGVETVRTKGEWIDVNGDSSLWKCNNCGEMSCCKGNYCPDCGANMRGEGEEPDEQL